MSKMSLLPGILYATVFPDKEKEMTKKDEQCMGTRYGAQFPKDQEVFSKYMAPYPEGNAGTVETAGPGMTVMVYAAGFPTPNQDQWEIHPVYAAPYRPPKSNPETKNKDDSQVVKLMKDVIDLYKTLLDKEQEVTSLLEETHELKLEVQKLSRWLDEKIDENNKLKKRLQRKKKEKGNETTK